jgi:uracil-DNA glycosylase family 4
MTPISASGPQSEIMIVGDYPTEDEYQRGIAFEGGIKRFTNGLLAPYKWKVENSYCTHYIKIQIPGFKSKIKKIKKAAFEKANAVADWKAILKEEINAVRPNSILAFGELALNALTGEQSITKHRGSIIPITNELTDLPINVVPCLSMRDIVEQNEVPYSYTQWDIGKIFKIKDLKSFYKPKELIWIVKSPGDLAFWWDDRASKGRFLTFDIETHHGLITCISFCHDGYEAISVPLLIGNKMDGYSKGILYQIINRILNSPIPKVNQNIKYDSMKLEDWGFYVDNIIGDTMLMQSTIYSELPKGLDFLCSVYTDQPYYKDEGKEYDPRIHTPDKLLIYNAKDSLVAWQTWDNQLNDAHTLGVKRFFFDNVMPAFHIFKRMERRGITVDDLERKKLLMKYKPLYDENRTVINLIAGEQINPLSPAQVGRFVYEILKCPKLSHTTESGKEAYDTDEDTIEELYINKISDNGIKEVLKRLIFARKLGKVIQFLVNPISPDGKMRTSFRLGWAKTGRNSAGKALDYDYKINWKKERIEEINIGGSFQTIPKHGFKFGKESFGKDLRRIFVPSSGYCFIEGDQAQAEDRVVCVLAEDWEGMEVLNKKEFKRNKNGFKDDRHVITAMLITGKSFADIEYDDRQYLGKEPRHAGNYDAGAGVLSVMTHFEWDRCKQILGRFHEISPNIRGVFHAGIKQLIDNFRNLTSPHGRRRQFFGRVDETMYRQAFSTIPQATVSDHGKFTILSKLVELFPEPVAFPVCESHDSLTFEVLIDAKDNFTESFHKVGRTPINFEKCSLKREYDLIIPIETQLGEISWGEMVNYGNQ